MGELDLALSLRAQGASNVEVRSLVAVAGALAVVPDPEIDASFADALEARLLTEGLEESTVVTPLRPVRRTVAARPSVARPVAPKTSQRVAAVVPLPRRRFVVRKAMAVAIAAAMTLALPIAAGAQSLPSSPLYRVKLAMEDARSFFTSGDVNKGFFELQRAQTRFDEVSQELALGHASVAAATVERMKGHQRKGADLIINASPSAADLQRVEGLMRGLAQQLTGLLPSAQGVARSPIITAILQAEAIANGLSGQLGLPAAALTVLPQADHQMATESSVSKSGGSSTGGTSGTSGGSSPKVDEDPGKRVHDGVDQGCRVPGSANGLGDVVAPLAKVFCTQ